MRAASGVGLDEISTFLGAVAWPLVVLVIALFFRKPLTALLRRDDVQVSAPGGFSISAKSQVVATRALMEAAAKSPETPLTPEDAESGVEVAALGVEALGRAPRILWVDDNPSNNRSEMAALHALGMHVTLSTSTEEALGQMASVGAFDLVISDMGRPGDRRAGYTLLDTLRQRGDRTPYVIYASSRSRDDFDEAVRRGALGCTNRPDELITFVTNALRGPRV
ncbi:response regulator [Ornithinimicrobium humiphilum]|uniref:response regulator n=1 Tax=Ornithinimicrobium humiphilum TaxID=125288 RepID=UPI0014785FF5|nr:response regulator [Ornithinimicrobium humiphilum]